MIKNYMEIIVDHVLLSVFEMPEYQETCKCNSCIEDIKSIALNNLDPKYVATDKGVLYTKLTEMRNQCTVDVTKEIIKAIELVKDSPRHE